MTIRKEDVTLPSENETKVWNSQQVAKALDKSPDGFRIWKNSKRAERFNRVVQEVEPNRYYVRSVIRYMEGAAL